MRAVITVVGKDQVGILAAVATACAQAQANVIDVSQTVMDDDFFSMTMLVDISQLNLSFKDFQDHVSASQPAMDIKVIHENIFDAMHEV